MQTMRENWSDGRLDDLNGKVDRGFERVDADVRALRTETKAEFTGLRNEMKAGFERMDERFDAMQRTMVQGAIALAAATIAGFAAITGLIATQL